MHFTLIRQNWTHAFRRELGYPDGTPLLHTLAFATRFATWGEFDLDAGVWSIPAARMKMKEAHVVPLVPAAVLLLRQMHAAHGDEWDTVGDHAAFQLQRNKAGQRYDDAEGAS